MRLQPIRALDLSPKLKFHNKAARSGLAIAFIVTGVLDGVLSLVFWFRILLKRGGKAKEGKEHTQMDTPLDMRPRNEGVDLLHMEHTAN